MGTFLFFNQTPPFIFLMRSYIQSFSYKFFYHTINKLSSRNGYCSVKSIIRSGKSDTFSISFKACLKTLNKSDDCFDKFFDLLISLILYFLANFAVTRDSVVNK